VFLPKRHKPNSGENDYYCVIICTILCTGVFNIVSKAYGICCNHFLSFFLNGRNALPVSTIGSIGPLLSALVL